MAVNPLHSKQTAPSVHTVVAYVYANAAARTGATGFTSEDLYKLAWQSDNGTLWVLTATTPTWSQIAAGGSLPPHASTHENGGADEISVAGLSGALADPQTPSTHASTHSDGGSDEITIEGLATSGAVGTVPTSDGSGGLTMGAPAPAIHASTHENGGADEISVAGLSGLLADPQTPTSHASTHSDGGSDEITVEDLATSGADGSVPTSDGAGGLAMAVPPSAVVTWGNRYVSNTTTTRYLDPAFERSQAATSPIQWRAPRAGTARNLRVRHNVTAGNGNAIVYTLRVNGTPSALSASLNSTASDGADTSNSVSVSSGDLLDIAVTKASDVGTTPQFIVAALEFA